MLIVHTAPVVEPEPQHGWQLVFWLGEAFDFETRFREALAEIVAILQPFGPVRLDLPLPTSDEDFVEGSLMSKGAAFKTYFEYALGYLAIMSDDRIALEAVATKVLPFVEVRGA